ncbi:hypothetical protein BC628DRAFT_1427720 [Trametes gibbosa]|nr:hypothetical protein BC628DRAFT_1427720 [Trametes gibbosa]
MASSNGLFKSPSVTSLSLSSPYRTDTGLKPNPHPYAIKTTSTALLTRSHTAEHNVSATHHYYVPLSPNPSKSEATKGHRATKSLNSMSESPTREAPRPLPIPPPLDTPSDRRNGFGSAGYASADESSKPRRRPRRSETMPSISLPASNTGLLAPMPSVEDLPENAKLWTPSQLATYLTSALRVTSNGKPGEAESIGLPPLVAKDIASFVKSARIGGRTFLRMNEEDFEALGMNKKWRRALLAALRNLRQNVLKGRIWGTDGSPTSSPSIESVSSGQIFSNPIINSSSSSIESSASLSTGEDDTAGAVLGRSKARRYKNGRVRGMIETFERSGSFSSEGGLEDGETGLSNERVNLRRWVRQEGQITGQSAMIEESPSPSRRRPLPVPPTITGASSGPLVDDEEPTIETLLAQVSSSQPATGARAWEEIDLEPGVTVKRIPSGESEADMSVDRTLVGIGGKSVSSLGSGRGSGGSSKGKPERRVVTAIFSPAAAEPSVPGHAASTEALIAHSECSTHCVLNAFVNEQKDSVLIAAAQDLAQSRPLPPLPDMLPDAVDYLGSQGIFVSGSEPAEEPTQLERLLEAEIMATRALLDTFRARLETVEQKVAEMEASEAQRDTELAARTAGASVPTRPAPVPELHALGSVEIGVQSGSAVAVVDVEIQSDPSPDPLVHSSDLARETSGAGGVKTPSSPVDKPSSPPSALQAMIPHVVRQLPSAVGLFSLSSSDSDSASRRKRDEGEDPTTMTDLPSYVLLVGLGVCAVVLRVVFRKVVGRGAAGAWKP